jgi:type III secretory pathway component EscR
VRLLPAYHEHMPLIARLVAYALVPLFAAYVAYIAAFTVSGILFALLGPQCLPTCDQTLYGLLFLVSFLVPLFLVTGGLTWLGWRLIRRIS